MKLISLLVYSALLQAIVAAPVLSQAEVISHTRLALKAGNSKDLSRYFNDMVDVTFDGEKGSYSKVQAEFVLKDFFRRNSPIDFEYIHQGSSKEGLKYAIGRYTAQEKSFRVVVYIKQAKGNGYLVDLIDFSKE
jgi:hypothetical protein